MNVVSIQMNEQFSRRVLTNNVNEPEREYLIGLDDADDIDHYGEWTLKGGQKCLGPNMALIAFFTTILLLVIGLFQLQAGIEALKDFRSGTTTSTQLGSTQAHHNFVLGCVGGVLGIALIFLALVSCVALWRWRDERLAVLSMTHRFAVLCLLAAIGLSGGILKYWGDAPHIDVLQTNPVEIPNRFWMCILSIGSAITLFCHIFALLVIVPDGWFQIGHLRWTTGALFACSIIIITLLSFIFLDKNAQIDVHHDWAAYMTAVVATFTFAQSIVILVFLFQHIPQPVLYFTLVTCPLIMASGLISGFHQLRDTHLSNVSQQQFVEYSAIGIIASQVITLLLFVNAVILRSTASDKRMSAENGEYDAFEDDD